MVIPASIFWGLRCGERGDPIASLMTANLQVFSRIAFCIQEKNLGVAVGGRGPDGNPLAGGKNVLNTAPWRQGEGVFNHRFWVGWLGRVGLFGDAYEQDDKTHDQQNASEDDN
ncbi:MAG: hypothetical protein HW380_3776 [Magnetococcales bacterium]|nr:hypothetical protein [Magnetococcales bacterium]